MREVQLLCEGSEKHNMLTKKSESLIKVSSWDIAR